MRYDGDIMYAVARNVCTFAAGAVVGGDVIGAVDVVVVVVAAGVICSVSAAMFCSSIVFFRLLRSVVVVACIFLAYCGYYRRYPLCIGVCIDITFFFTESI